MRSTREGGSTGEGGGAGQSVGFMQEITVYPKLQIVV